MAVNIAPASRMKLPHKDEKLSELTRAFDISLAIVQVERDESQEQAWLRHLKKHPDDKLAAVKVFHYSA